MKLIRDDDFEANLLGILDRYMVSWYARVDHIDHKDVVDGREVPIARGDDLVAALRENVEQARYDRDGAKNRYEQAQRDGLFDLKRVEQVSNETREKWLAAVDVMKGDKGRCISELRHWREYLGLALKGELPELKRVGDPRQLARALADAKSIEPDRRLPKEPDDAELF